MPLSLDRPKSLSQRVLWNYGAFYGRLHGLVAIPAALALGVCMVGLHRAQKDDTDFERLWAGSSGRLREELDYVDSHLRDGWNNLKFNVAFGVEKGRSDLGKDGNVLTKNALEDVLAVYKFFHEIKVVTNSNKTYTAPDLCSRGAMPDYPGNSTMCALYQTMQCTPLSTSPDCALLMQGCMPSPKMPCVIIGPIDCFNEALEYQDLNYRQFDKVMAHLPQFKMQSPTPYTFKSSFRNLTDEQIRLELTSKLRAATGQPGCTSWTGMAAFPWEVMIGTPSREDGIVIGAEALAVWFFMDGPERIKFRLSVDKPGHGHIPDIKEALKKFNKKFMDGVNAMSTASLKIGALGNDAFEEFRDEAQEAPIVSLVVGMSLMLVFVAIVFARPCKPLHSRLQLGLFGFGLVLYSFFASMGIIAWADIKFNPPMIQALPFLALGLGVNDMFVLVWCLNEIGVPTLAQTPPGQVLASVLGQAGTSCTLTSLCNVIVFLSGLAINVPGMQAFCKSCAIVAAVNWFAMMTILPAAILLEAMRVGKSCPEILLFCCHRRSLAREDDAVTFAEFGSNLERLARDVLVKRLAPCLTRRRVSFSIALFTAIALGLSIASAVNMDLGYQPADVVPSGDKRHFAMEAMFSHITLFPSFLCFKALDYPKMQGEVLKLHARILDSKYGLAFPGAPWLTSFYRFVGMMSATSVPGAAPGNTFRDFGFVLNGSSFQHNVYAPLGIATTDPAAWYQQMAKFSVMPLTSPQQAFATQGMPWLLADASLVPLFSLRNTSDSVPSATNPFTFTMTIFFIRNLRKQRDFIDADKMIRKVIDTSPFQNGGAFPWGFVTTYWGVFQDLSDRFWVACAIGGSSIFVLSALLLASVWSAIVSCIMSLVILMNIYGLSATFLEFNIFTATALLVAFGMSIECTAHIVAGFRHASGTTEERLGTSLQAAMIPIILGSLSTVIGISPLAFNDITFLVKYFFLQFVLVVIAGVVNAIGPLPALLVLFDNCMNTLSQKPAGLEQSPPVILGSDPGSVDEKGGPAAASSV